MSNYAIVGGGRLARHFSQYFQLLEIPHTRWTRDGGSSFNSIDLANAGQRLRKTVARADRVLLLVSDHAITPLLKRYPFLHERPLLHCCGALSIPGVAGVHPLMTFSSELYDLQTYLSVPFMYEAGQSFEELFPELDNPHFAINVEDKSRYHAMCVMAGNFSQLLWKGVSDRMERQFDLPTNTLHPYLAQLVSNFRQAPGTALTGPLVRKDIQSINRNISSLEGDPMQDLYRAFVAYYQHENRQSGLLEKIS